MPCRFPRACSNWPASVPRSTCRVCASCRRRAVLRCAALRCAGESATGQRPAVLCHARIVGGVLNICGRWILPRVALSLTLTRALVHKREREMSCPCLALDGRVHKGKRVKGGASGVWDKGRNGQRRLIRSHVHRVDRSRSGCLRFRSRIQHGHCCVSICVRETGATPFQDKSKLDESASLTLFGFNTACLADRRPCLLR